MKEFRDELRDLLLYSKYERKLNLEIKAQINWTEAKAGEKCHQLVRILQEIWAIQLAGSANWELMGTDEVVDAIAEHYAESIVYREAPCPS